MFWKNWKNISAQEKDAILVIQRGFNIVKKSIPAKEIVSIYAKGSFPRRQMVKGSDIDIVVILKTSKYIPSLNIVGNRTYKESDKIPIEIRGYTLSELKTGKRLKTISSRTPPELFVKTLPFHQLLFGKDLKTEKLVTSSNRQDLKGMIHIVEKGFLPRYKQGTFPFHELAKQVFWLADNELRLKGITPPIQWRDLSKFYDKNHIVQDALRYREQSQKNIDKKRFVKRIELYCKSLKNELNKLQ